jgi:thioredoxin reductase (NADPH)
MTTDRTATIDSRWHQMFPTLGAAEIARLRRFGQVRTYPPGEALGRMGETGVGMLVILKGEVDVSQHDRTGRPVPIVTHGPGAFMGELAQLSGRPSLVDAVATTVVEAVVLPPERLRAVLVAEAELGERIMRALILRRVGLIEAGAGPVIVGREEDPDVLRLEGFLDRNGHPRQRLDPDVDEDARALIERLQVDDGGLPIVLCPDGALLRNPSEVQLARCIGMIGPLDPDRVYDVAVVGAGPAGLAASVYAASEGLSVLTLDCRAFGGQAGASARIENYLGFPTGIGGMALMARAYSQAQKFGAETAIPAEVSGLEPAGGDHAGFRLRLASGERLAARAVVIASGARYRRLDLAGIEAFEAASVHYWASPLEGRLCAGQEVALVGGGNSAGQAVVYLAGRAAKVWVLVRGPGLEAGMSRYLVDRIAALPNVEVVTRARIGGLEGTGGILQSLRWRDASGAETCRPVRHLFLFIGATPSTGWLSGSGVALDDKGFVLTGAELGAGHPLLETSRPGAFAIGDVRSGSIKRVASAVGEGAQAVAALHGFLAGVGAVAPVMAATRTAPGSQGR